jgi:1-acyl-sn-glycerol-3-phosphate acyltransferase
MMTLRSALFNAFFYVSTFIMVIPLAALSLVAPARVIAGARAWARLQVRAARLICGIRVEILGWENLPPPPALIASRHESTLDVLIWIALLPAACFVVKRELARIPLFGRCIEASGMIVVDREAGGAAMRALLREADRAVRERRHIVIFPEGTRVGSDEHPALQPGIAALVSRTGLPAVPVMTDSGKSWGRHAFRKRSGTIRVVIQEPLKVTTDRRAILDGLWAAFQSERLERTGATRARPAQLWNAASIAR